MQAAYLATLVDWTAVLAKGERGLLLAIGADARQAKIQRDYIEGVLDSSPLLSALVANRTADSLELASGIVIEVRAASFRRNRGVTCVGVIITEAAFLPMEESANADAEIFNAVRPSLATTGGPLIAITTPYSRRGVVWDTYRRHFGPGGDPEILVAQGTSRDFNPTLPQRVVDRAMERDPAAASAEYLALFRVDIESFVPREVIDAAVVPGRFELPPMSGVGYVAAIDPAGGSGADSMTLAIAYRDKDGRAVVAAIRERRPPFSPSDVVLEFSATLKAYGIQKVVGDRFGGEFVREPFRRTGLTYELAEMPKSDFYRDALPLLTSSKTELLDHPRLVAQFCSLERRTSRGTGKDSIDHGPNQHDDIANVVAMVMVLAAGGAAAINWQPVAQMFRAGGHLVSGGDQSAPTPLFGGERAMLQRQMRARRGGRRW